MDRGYLMSAPSSPDVADRLCWKCQKADFVPKRFDSSVRVGGVELPVLDLEYSECPKCGNEPVFAEQAGRNDEKFAAVRRNGPTLGILVAS